MSRTLSRMMLSVCLFWFSSTSFLWAQMGVPIAALQELRGEVNLTLQENGRTAAARPGKLLREDDVIQTGRDGRVTVLFRNGSALRLFENSELSIRRARETLIEERSFEIDLNLKTGSLRANFLPGRQIARLHTPVVQIDVQGTVFRVNEGSQGSTIAVTEGRLLVSNGNSSLTLYPGQRLNQVSFLDDLSEKLETIPTQLVVESAPSRVDLGTSELQTLTLLLQLTDLQSRRIVRSSGPVYLESDYYNLRFPSSANLDSTGFVRIPVKIGPPPLADKKFDGRIIIRAFLDGSRFDPHGEGSLILETVGFPVERKLAIDATSGMVQVEE